MFRAMRGFGALVLGLVLLAPGLVMAQATPIFPVDSTTVTQVKTDILAWGTALMAVVLAIYAYRKVKAIVR